MNDEQVQMRRSERMDNRRYTLNKKAFAVTRAMGSGSDHDKKWDYIHVSPKGVICTDTSTLIRVTLPDQPNPPTSAQIFTQEIISKLRPKSDDEKVTMPEGLDAKSTGQHSVPNFDHAIPSTNSEIANITVTAKSLIEVLKGACEVTDHARFLVRLRICQVGKNPMLRIDAHRDEGGQEFCGVVMGTIYNGVNIPGDKNDEIETKPNETIDEKKLTLPMSEGRRFRD